jgi:hypothetical protein
MEIETKHHTIKVSSHRDEICLEAQDTYIYPGWQLVVAFITKEQARALGEELIKLAAGEDLRVGTL